jgi:sensor histidine kinase YesM
LLETYVYLQQKRFGEALVFENQISDPTLLKHRLPPMSLQLLAENAIKHNSLLPEKPLLFSIRLDGKQLIVSNPIQRKKYPEKGEGIGLENIKSRFALYTSKPVVIDDDGRNFTLYLPLIDPE